MAKSRRSSEFENPSEVVEATAETAAPGDVEFENPADVSNEEEFAASASGDDSELAVSLSAADSGVVQLKTAIESLLVAQAGPHTEGVAFAASDLGGTGNIQGVGYALGTAASGGEPGATSLVVFTAEPTSEDEVKGSIANAAAASDEELDATPVTVVTTGLIEAFAHRFRARPAPCGISVGHFNITAGTIGALARGRSGVRRNRLLLLSNNHVLADVNAGPIGAAIIQPGKFDGGVNPRDRIGSLERFVPVNFAAGSVNFVDCATAWVNTSLVRKEFVHLVNGQQRFFRVNSQTIQAQVGMIVGKSGRTTQLTQGRITAIGVTVNVNFGNGRVGTFRDQFSVVSTTTGANFSQGGDSGSLIWTWNPARNPVGLLFAGGGGVTFANRIDRVKQALDIDLVT
ncbi:MAG: hypothetical protein SFU86_11430 [Pirellulaceae bacterium]|nr:hypothetical protein [Pirellulaceae bacterium]